MASTYVNDLRLEEMATGDQSGTWGDTTNTNLELIAEAFSYGTEASFGSDADATTTIADGATDPARSLYLKVTSGASLTATRTLTIAPNTVSKIWIIENATSGSQSINISQGSGANVTIPNGDVKVIYTDGAGSGAAVVDAFTDLNLSGTTTVAALDAGSGAITTTGTVTGGTLAGTLSTAAQTNITSVGTLSSLTVSGDLTVDTSTLKVDSTNNRVGIGTTSPSYQLDVENSASASDSSTISVVSGTSGYAQLLLGDTESDARGYVVYQNSNDSLQIASGGSERMRIDSSGNVGIGTTSPNNGNLDIRKTGLSTGITNVLMNANFADGSNGSGLFIGYRTDETTAVLAPRTATGNLAFYNYDGAWSESMRITNTGNVGIGTDSPSGLLHVQSASSGATASGNADELILEGSGNTGLSILSGATSLGNIFFADSGDTADGYINYDQSGRSMRFGTATTERMRIDASGNVGIGTSSPSSYQANADDLVVATTGHTGITIASGTSHLGNIHFADGTSGDDAYRGFIQYDHITNYMRFATNASEAMRIDSSGNVGIGLTSPAAPLDVVSNSGSTGVNIRGRSSDNNGSLYFTSNANIATEYGFIQGRSTDLRIQGFNNGLILQPNSGNVGIGTDSPSAKLEVNGGSDMGIRIVSDAGGYSSLQFGDSSDSVRGAINYNSADDSLQLRGYNNVEAMRIDSSGRIVIHKTNAGFEVAGITITAENNVNITADGDIPLQCNRLTNDGSLVTFSQDTSQEGTISVSGSTVSYNGFSGNHETSGISTDTEIGTVCSTIDELDTYVSGTKSGQTRTDHAKIKVSDTVGDTRVYGVLVSYSEIDNKPIVASVGIGSVKVTGACSGGDLLESNGDGTAKVQSDDIVKSKTIGKVTIGNSDTGVKLVSCVLYCG